MNALRPGDLVRYAKPFPDDGEYPLRVIWCDRGRTMIEQDIGFEVNPCRIVLTSDLELSSTTSPKTPET